MALIGIMTWPWLLPAGARFLAMLLTSAAGTGELRVAADPAGIKLCNSNVKLLNLIEEDDALIKKQCRQCCIF